MRRLSAALAAFFVVSLAWGQGYPKTNATKLWNVSIAQPVAGDDGQYLRFNYAANTLTWEAVVSGPTWDSTLDAATGNETAFNVAYTVNKATSGNDTGLLISMTDTSSPGTSKPLSIQTGAAGTTEAFSVANDGTTSILSDTAQLKLGASGDVGIQRSTVGAGWLRVTNGGANTGSLEVSNIRIYDSAEKITINPSGTGLMSVHSGFTLRWANDTSNTWGSWDSGFERASAGVVKVTDGAAGSGSILTRNTRAPLTADAVLQMGYIAMPDVGTDGRFDAAGANATNQIGVVTGTGATAQGTEYGIAVSGIAYVAVDEATTRGHWICTGATAGLATDSATLCTAGQSVGMAVYSEATFAISTTAASTEVITLASAPGWAVNDPVIYMLNAGSAISGLTSTNVYWVKTITDATLTVSATKGGAAVDLPDWSAADGPYLQRLTQTVLRLGQ